MEIINPNEIGAKISTLIAEANEKFYAVTPYIKISEWKKIIVSLERAKERNISIKFYIREINQIDFETLTKLGVEIFEIKGLHTKLYFNEKDVIISSMNLYEFSDLNSIDIAIYYKDTENYNKFYDYFLKYIKTMETKKYFSKNSENILIEIQEYLVDRFSNSKINLSSDYLFSKNLLQKFDVFIRQNEMTLKLPNKKVTNNEILELTNAIEAVVTIQKVKTNKPRETYNYYTWDIDTTNFTILEITNLITNLKKI